jgi:pyruvate ferredoxin oxidoreductase alpha subunit
MPGESNNYGGGGSLMANIIGMTGDHAIAYAAKQCDVDVVAVYPITPQTIIVERFSDYVANGEVKTEYVCVESEHSAMSACVGASTTGARVFTATSSQGLALMHEILYIASSLRCPIVMAVANRALSAPINIHCDHSDMMGSRDCGWIQIYCENAQEAYDLTIQAFKIAEDPDILLPVTVNLDGFITSHCMEGVNIIRDDDVKTFLPPRKVIYKLDPANPITIGALCFTDYYFEIKAQQEDAMTKVSAKVKEVGEEFGKITGRNYGLIETFGLGDAEAAIMCLGSTAGTARVVANKLRKAGKPVGVIKVRLFRPFPSREIVEAVKGLKALTVLDRVATSGAPSGPLCSDVKTALYAETEKPLITNVIYGLGGRDISPLNLEKIFNDTLKTASIRKIDRPIKYVGVRE